MKERILGYIKRYGYITTWDAFRELGCTRLSEYIRQLREEYNIVGEKENTINRYGDKTFYYKYRIVEEENDIKGTI